MITKFNKDKNKDPKVALKALEVIRFPGLNEILATYNVEHGINDLK